MVRKFELHADALTIIGLLFIAAVCFIAYQRHQYSDLLQDNIDRQLKQLSLEMEVARLQVLLERSAKAGPKTRAAPKSEKSLEQSTAR